MQVQAVRQVVEAFVGAMTVILPSHFIGYNKTTSTVTVSHDDLNRYVYIQEQGRDRYEKLNGRFKGRTSWSDGCLFLREPQISDSGNYTFILRELGVEVNKILIQLDVKETFGNRFSGSWDVFLLGFVIAILIVMAAFTACRYWKKTRAAVASVGKIIVREGVSSVKLASQITTDLLQGDIVEWLRFGSEPRVVSQPANGHGPNAANQRNEEEGGVLMSDEPKVVYRHEIGPNEPETPHESYRERTQMPDLQNNGLTLTLTRPRPDDSGIYLCTVRRGGNTLRHEVELVVKKRFCF